MKQDEGTGLWVNDDGTTANLARPEVLEKFAIMKDEAKPDDPGDWWQG